MVIYLADTIARAVERPTRKLRAGHPLTLPYLVLLRVGFTVPWMSPPRRCALTAPFHPYHRPERRLGGMFSVALSFRSPGLGVSQHTALWSSDFPLVSPWPKPRRNQRPSGRLGQAHGLCAPFAARATSPACLNRPAFIHPSPARSRTARASCRGCCAACR